MKNQYLIAKRVGSYFSRKKYINYQIIESSTRIGALGKYIRENNCSLSRSKILAEKRFTPHLLVDVDIFDRENILVGQMELFIDTPPQCG